jgi:hypothetical protein
MELSFFTRVITNTSLLSIPIDFDDFPGNRKSNSFGIIQNEKESSA